MPFKMPTSAFSYQSKSLGFELYKGHHFTNNERRRVGSGLRKKHSLVPEHYMLANRGLGELYNNQ